jgi:redox-sensitive bicupin YhaK (pirin superfamily)
MPSSQRPVKQLHTALDATSASMDHLLTYTALPYAGERGERDFKRFDPFLVLNHHGVQHFPPHNQGLPFGPHPHRGIETLTFIYQGDLTHRDSTGTDSVIKAGGVQWMTAGKGIIHEEVSSREFKDKGGTLDIIQVWFNLPRSLKMIPPHYVGLQKDQIPEVKSADGKTTVHPVSGNWRGAAGSVAGPVPSVTQISIATLEIKTGGRYSADVPGNETVLLYVVNGKIKVNGQIAEARVLVEFENPTDPAAEGIEIEALENSTLIFGHGEPYHEPIVAYGPFVMNTAQEIEQAYADYRAGLFQ